AENFWPIYNEYYSEIRKLKSEVKLKKPDRDISEAEASDFLEKLLDLEQKEVDLKREYLNKLKPHLPLSKILRLQFIEGDFRREVLSEVRNRYKRKDRN
ncbi:MAG: hypothetical protein R3250_08315, partial [Melioribacteraceae bacterium]|nr:hypothetical protein [Melioribacteraceae bacterium]